MKRDYLKTSEEIVVKNGIYPSLIYLIFIYNIHITHRQFLPF